MFCSVLFLQYHRKIILRLDITGISFLFYFFNRYAAA